MDLISAAGRTFLCPQEDLKRVGERFAAVASLAKISLQFWLPGGLVLFFSNVFATFLSFACGFGEKL